MLNDLAFISNQHAAYWIDEIRHCEWLKPVLTTDIQDDISPVELCNQLAMCHAAHFDDIQRKNLAQFFTPPRIANFMASLVHPLTSGSRVVEPAAGCGILIAALAERFCDPASCSLWCVAAYELDSELRPALFLALAYIQHWLSRHGVRFEFEVITGDFLLLNAPHLRITPALLDSGAELPRIDLIIANPPYFKVPKSDQRVELISEIAYGQPNIYTMFMAAAAKMLRPEGELVFITPRSFCAGPYFQQFRKWFFHQIALTRLHLFTSRTEAFDRDAVLQENIILVGAKCADQPEQVVISHSQGAGDLEDVDTQRLEIAEVLDVNSDDYIVSIPVQGSDAAVRSIFNRWTLRLHTLGLEISTGPVIPFRTDALVEQGAGIDTAPVFWIQHVSRMGVNWPLFRFSKPQWINVNAKTRRLLIANANYVMVRRFSPKEENCRITAAPHLKGSLSSEFLGIENHVNYIHRPGGNITDTEAIGLAAFLNSRWVDQYFRLSSGNTQVSATELRSLPMPSRDDIIRIGEKIQQTDDVSQIALINAAVGEVLNMPMDINTNNGAHMPKIEEAKDLLKSLGLPAAQHNELAALALLALANLSEKDSWRLAQQRGIRIHDMIQFIEQNYHKRYAENTRETFRRQVLHQFEQARIIDRNPNEPDLPTNSPRTSYALSKQALVVIQSYGTRTGKVKLSTFVAEQGTLSQTYQKMRAQNQIAFLDVSGNTYHLSPGKHNQLQVMVLEQFIPRFAVGSKLLYLGDTANKSLIVETDELAKIGFTLGKHDKLPDIVLFHPRKKWLYLIEVVTSHGPVSPKRYMELEKVLAPVAIGRIYVSVFPDFKEYLRHARNVAWETEIWISEAPDHLIHYNGDKFMGPRPPHS